MSDRVSIARMRAAERVWLCGRASLLAADTLPDLVWVELEESLEPPGTVLVTVYGPEPERAYAHMSEHAPAGTQLVLRGRPVTWVQRAKRWLASRWWRWVLSRMRMRAYRRSMRA